MIKIFASILFLSLFISGCFSDEQKQAIKENRIELGDIKINYYSDKSVTSLEVPPDLTSPSYDNSFRLSEYVKDISPNTVNLTNKESLEIGTVLSNQLSSDIELKKSGVRRWLVVNQSPEIVWNLSKQFFKEQGFVIKKSKKEIGIMVTDYLENKKPKIPGKTMGFFRSMIAEQIENVNYTLPVVDRYHLRIEPLESGSKTELHLAISSMAEVISGTGDNQTTYWQKQERNIPLENEMLLSLMSYLGGDSAEARAKIISSKDENKLLVDVSDGLNGYAKLVFNVSFIDAWDNLAWAILESDIEIEDKDLKEKTFYLALTPDQGFMSKLLGDRAARKTYQIQLKEISDSRTEVFFNDVSEENEVETKKYSYEFFNQIKKLLLN